MISGPRSLSLLEWDAHYDALVWEGLQEPWYGGRLSRHVRLEGDRRLQHLRFDPSPAALRLWNFLLTENLRLREARRGGARLIGAMKDLGTVPVMAFALPNVRAFYPDGAWWTPCLMECSDGLLQRAEALGIDATFCPVRAMLPAFESGEHFPIPDLLVCSVGAVCDDFSAIAQRLERRGFPIEWWEVPRRRAPEPGEEARPLPGNLLAPAVQVDWVRDELSRVAKRLEGQAGVTPDEAVLRRGIRRANEVRDILRSLRAEVYGATEPPLPALEMLVAEMLAIHFCSDREEAQAVLGELLAEARRRLRQTPPRVPDPPVRVYWVNPVADLRMMNLIEDWGARLCGSDYMFAHALDAIPEDVPPLEGLARAALADPMVGPVEDRARRIIAECRHAGAEAVVVSRVPGASHCAYEGEFIRERVRQDLGIPSLELEVPSLTDAMLPTLCSRIQALVETAKARR